jgi:pyridinium-3,5-bisthiocarboxylic acid mononucleotide nickel chelatase
VDSQLVFDCFSGIAGDMTIAALVSAGASLERVAEGLRRLPLPAFEVATTEVTRGGLRALHLEVTIAEERTYQPDEMRVMVRAAAFPARVEERALGAIGWLERGEAGAHGTNRPHLHEAGGVDAVIDLVGSMLALEDLGIGACFCPVVTVGSGTIARTSHGPIPAAPGPAAAHILQQAGFAVRFVEAGHELVTPTGAAILAAVATPGPVTITPLTHGAGAGTFDPPGRPNALRVFVGEETRDQRPETRDSRPSLLAPPSAVVSLETNIDDMTPELLANARDRLLEEGALDAWLEPIGMKKGRAASKLCALARPGDEERLAGVFLRETSTLGVRVNELRRYEAARRIETFASSLGEARFKVRELAGRERAEPEWEDVKALAAKHGWPAIEVSRRLTSEWDRQRSMTAERRLR